MQIDKAFKILENVTCVRFVNYTNQADFITITGDTDHCSSKVGRQGGEQFVKLMNRTVGEGCFKIHTIQHEIIHSLGFYHIHKGADRDKHIRIIWKNVIPEKKHKLKIKGNYDELSDFDVGYDVDSIMHYTKKAYSKNGKNTIETIDPTLIDRIGQRTSLSDGDIQRINRMYECE